MSDHELLDRIAAGPETDELDQLAVYADQLIERGDPHGELIVAATQRSRSTAERRRREAALIDDQRVRLDAVIGSELHPTYTWKRGFIDAIRFDYRGDAKFDALPKLAGEPILRLLRRIELVTMMLDGDGDVGPVIAELAGLAPRFPRLVEFAVRYAGNIDNPWIDGPTDIHDVTPLYAAFPRLEVLELRGDRAELGAIDLPDLRELIVPRLVADDVRRLVAARLPRLTRLDAAFTGRFDNARAILGPLLHRDFGPQFKALSIGPPPDAIDYVLDELPTCPLARHLTSLAFRGAELQAQHLRVLLDRAPELRRLERIELVGRPISASMTKRLFEVYGRVAVLV